MEETTKENLAESVKGYKEKINPKNKATLKWERDLIFQGRTQEGYEIDFDGHVQWGCKPTDALLLALASCMGIDMVMFLQKMKVQLADFRMDIVGERNPTPPQYYTAVDMTLHIAGENIDRKKVDRAVALSHEKYCSVYNSLRKDIKVNINCVIEEKKQEAALDSHQAGS